MTGINRILFWMSAIGAVMIFTGQAFVYAEETKRLEQDVTAEIIQRYDDNVTYTKDATESDYITALALEYTLKHESKKGKLFLSAGITQEFFADNSSFNNLFEEFKADYERDITNYRKLLVTEEFIHAEEPRSFQDAFGQTNGRFDYYLNRFNLQHVWELNSDLTVLAGFKNEFYDPARADIAMSVLNNVNMEADYHFSQTFTGLISYAFGLREFQPGGHLGNHTVRAGARQIIAEKGILDVRAGVDFVKQEGRDVSEPGVSVSYTHELNRRTKAALLFVKEHNHHFFAEDIFDMWTVSANISRQIWKRLSGHWRSFYGKGKFLSSGDKEEFVGSGLGLGYEIKDDVKLAFNYDYTRTQSNKSTREYDKNVISLSVRWEF